MSNLRAQISEIVYAAPQKRQNIEALIDELHELFEKNIKKTVDTDADTARVEEA